MRYISTNKKIAVLFKQNSSVFVEDALGFSEGLNIDNSTVFNLVKSFDLFSEFRLRKHSSYNAYGSSFLSLKLDLKKKEIVIFSNLDEKPSLEEAIQTILKRLYE
mgnify:CR=1 FL=1|jgi:hypothetical protein